MSSSSSSFLRLVAGFAVAPIMPALVLAAGLLAVGDEHARETLQYAPYAAFASYPIALVFGVPMFLVLRWRRWQGWRTYLLAGLALGVLLFVLSLVLSEDGAEGLPGHLRVMLPFLVASTVAASLAFWLIARPDRARIVPG